MGYIVAGILLFIILIAVVAAAQVWEQYKVQRTMRQWWDDAERNRQENSK